jgi:hypothetical protein
MILLLVGTIALAQAAPRYSGSTGGSVRSRSRAPPVPTTTISSGTSGAWWRTAVWCTAAGRGRWTLPQGDPDWRLGAARAGAGWDVHTHEAGQS